MSAGQLFARDALLPDGWARDVLLAWDAQGAFTSVTAGAAPAPGVPQAAGPVLPGMPNLHSHAFQRGFAGLTEYRTVSPDGDDPAIGYGERLGGGPVGVDGQDVSDDDEVRSAGHEVDARPQGLTYGLEHVLVLGYE